MNHTLAQFNGIISELNISGSDNGPLFGTRFAVKDLLDVAGYVTGAGNPDWQRTHAPALKTAAALSSLLDAGASLVGKACTDEFAFSIDGINIHFGIPINPQYTGRIPGGSSSGSASAVATKLVDFALGTDTGGSVRVPASYCGIYGFRPTHGRVSVEGVVPLTPCLDTVGWFARDPHLMTRCASVLLKPESDFPQTTKILIADDAFEFAHDEVRPAYKRAIQTICDRFETEHITLADLDWQSYISHFRTIQGWEAWQCYGQWIRDTNPTMAAPIKDRFDFARKITEQQYDESTSFRKRIIDRFETLLSGTTVLCLPTTWGLPPLIKSSADQLLENRLKTMQLTCIASLAGAPQITIPIRLSDSHTTATGLSFMALRQQDMMLFHLSESLTDLTVSAGA